MIRLAAIVVMLPALCAGQISIEWSDGPKLPVGLGGHVAAVIQNELIVAGGTSWDGDRKSWHDDVWKLTTTSWRECGKLHAPLALPAMTVDKDRLFFAGGSTDQGSTFAYHLYAPWRNRAGARLPYPRAAAGAAYLAQTDTIYVIGGVADVADFKTATTRVFCLIGQEGSRWKDAAPLPKPLALAATVTLGGSIYHFGGMGPIDAVLKDSADTFRYDPATNQWKALAPSPGARRGAVAVAFDDRYILLIGGCRNENEVPVMLDEVLAYDTREDRYHACGAVPYAAFCQAAVIKDGKLYVIGGEDKPRQRTDRVVIGRIRQAEK